MCAVLPATRTTSPTRYWGRSTARPSSASACVSWAPGIGSSGIHIDADGHVLDTAGQVIPGLHAVGSCAAYTTTGVGYNSGFALGRGITLAYQVSQELAGLPVLP
jgi:3-oxosteroid 1-dehydrogenase